LLVSLTFVPMGRLILLGDKPASTQPPESFMHVMEFGEDRFCSICVRNGSGTGIQLQSMESSLFIDEAR
jgi:hypothetical protein